AELDDPARWARGRSAARLLLLHARDRDRLKEVRVAPVPSSDENKRQIRLLIEEGLNAGNFAMLEQHVQPTYLAHVPGMSGVPQGPGAIRETISMWQDAFDDWHMTIEDLVAEGDFVAVRYTTTGTHTGPLFGIPATGRRIKMEAMQLHRLENGKV